MENQLAYPANWLIENYWLTDLIENHIVTLPLLPNPENSFGEGYILTIPKIFQEIQIPKRKIPPKRRKSRSERKKCLR
jgi:hypothetical protein